MSSKSLFICFNHNEQVRSPVGADEVICVRIVRVEVVDVDKFSSFVNYNFISFVLHCHVLMLLQQSSKNILSLGEGSVPLSELAVSQVLVI